MSRRDIRERLAGVRPTLADRVVSYFDPVAGARRFQARMALAVAGAYTGGSRSKRSLSGFRTSGGSADADLLPDLPTLRERSRDMVRNAPLAGGAINTVTTNVIGTGLMPKFQPRRELLGWTEERAAAWARQVEQEFASWAESPNCDATRTQTFYGLQDLAFRSALENGDVFSRLPMIPGRGRYQLAVQLIEADRVCNKDGARDTATLAGGVELDGFGAPARYHFRTDHPGSLSVAKREWVVVDAFGAASGRRNVLHLYAKRRIGQTRGAPYLTPVIETLKQLDRYSEAEIFAAVANAVFAVKVTTPDKAGLSPLESATTGTTPGSDTTDARESGWDGTLTPGLVVDLGPDEDVGSVNPDRPNANYDPFFQSMAQLIGAGLELPAEVLLKRFMASYSASRAALLDAWKFFRNRRVWCADGFCEPIKDEWLAEAVARGRIDAPGFFRDPLLRYAYGYCTWHGDGPGSLNPKDEAAAAETRMRIQLTTLDEEKAAYDGGCAADAIEQAGREQAMKDKAGLKAAPAPGAPKPEEEGGTDDDDERSLPGGRYGSVIINNETRLGGQSTRRVDFIRDDAGEIVGAKETVIATDETELRIRP